MTDTDPEYLISRATTTAYICQDLIYALENKDDGNLEDKLIVLLDYMMGDLLRISKLTAKGM